MYIYYRHLLKVDLEEEQINLLIHVIHIGRFVYFYFYFIQ